MLKTSGFICITFPMSSYQLFEVSTLVALTFNGGTEIYSTVF